MKYYFEMPLNAQKILGDDFKFMFPKMGVFGETKEECEKEVREWQKEFIAGVKAKKNKTKNEEEPFPDNLHNKR